MRRMVAVERARTREGIALAHRAKEAGDVDASAPPPWPLPTLRPAGDDRRTGAGGWPRVEARETPATRRPWRDRGRRACRSPHHAIGATRKAAGPGTAGRRSGATIRPPVAQADRPDRLDRPAPPIPDPVRRGAARPAGAPLRARSARRRDESGY
ncbi:MAG: hypothetical protein ACK559_22400, partial [bacterium]